MPNNTCFTLRLKHCVGKERAIKLLSYLLIVSIKYHNFHSAFKPSLLVHMSFFKAILYTGGGFKMLTVADKGGRGLSLADIRKKI